MTNLKRQKLPTFLVVPDSSVLFNEKPTNLVSAGFETLWDELSKLADLQLFIPHSVVGERTFQLLSIARESVKSAHKSHETITSICDHKLSLLPTDDEIVKGISTRFDEWCRRKSAKILPTPVDKIDWNSVVEFSIWRKPPFSHDGNPKLEKGFRDCLILETLLDFGSSNPKASIVFLSNDRLLRETTISRFGGQTQRLVHSNLETFGSYLKLLHEKLTKEFVDLLIKKVEPVFYDEGNQECVYLKYGIPERIENEFAASLNSPQESNSLSAALLFYNPAMSITEWKSISDQKYFVYPTEFLQLEDKDIFHWKTQVELVQLFTKNPESESSYLDERIRKTIFDVFWSAQISDDGSFSDMQFQSIKEAQQTFLSPTIEEKTDYGFKVHPVERVIQSKKSSDLADAFAPFLLGNLGPTSTNMLKPPNINLPSNDNK